MSFPDVVRIEVSSACNFRCVHCPTGTLNKHHTLLKPDRFAQIIDHFNENNFVPRVVVLYHGGEPLLNKNLESYVKRLKDMGVKKTVITTNASLLTKDRASGLIEAGIDEIKVSFDGESAQENNEIRKGADFYRNASNVKELIRLKRDTGRDVPTVRISNTRIATHEELDKMDRANSFAFDDIPAYLKDFFGEYMSSLESQSFPAMAWPSMKSSDFKIKEIDNPPSSYCTNLFETITILVSGDITTCCYDLLGIKKFGNIFEESIFDIWSGYEAFRKNFKDGIYEEPCTNCMLVKPRFIYKETKLRCVA